MAAALRTRALNCPNCGAKLRWEQDAPVIECGYCHTHVAVSTGERTTLPTSVIAVPAPRLPRALLVLPIAALTIAGIVVVAVRNQGGRSAASGPAVRTSTTAELIATPLAATAAEVAARHGVTAHGNDVTFALSDGAFREAMWSWDREHPEHVNAIMLRPRDEASDLSAIATRANAQLAGRVRSAATGGHQFQTKAVGLSISTHVRVSAHPGSDPAWTRQLEALWTVTKSAALGTDDTIDDATRRDVLNLSYPISVLADIAFDTIVDGAAAEVKRVAPGADGDGASFRIGVAHPWFESATAGWDNAPGGRWSQAHLWFAAPQGMARLDEVAACLEPVLGPPAKSVADHLAGTYTLQYRARGGRPWLDVSAQLLQMYPHYGFGDPATADGLRAVITTLASCGSP